jgi:tetratricopeptide (TPR) repeat protein
MNLGRLDEAADKYQEAIEKDEEAKRFRDVAVGKVQLATVRLLQKNYAEAISAYRAALMVFETYNEPKSIAKIWHQIGIVHQAAGDYEAAETAYRRSLEISTQNNDRAGQARSLGQLGNLYDDNLNRPEEAVNFYRQAADIYTQIGDLANEGRARNNIAKTLHKLKRYDEARAEVIRAIECKQNLGHAGTVWNAFKILNQIEEEDGNHAAARAAWAQARDAYLAYRRQGGYAQFGGGRLVEHVLGLISPEKANEIQLLFDQLANDSEVGESLKQLIQAMITILNGSRDKALGDGPALDYDDAAEVLFLIERLGENR